MLLNSGHNLKNQNKLIIKLVYTLYSNVLSEQLYKYANKISYLINEYDDIKNESLDKNGYNLWLLAHDLDMTSKNLKYKTNDITYFYKI